MTFVSTSHPRACRSPRPGHPRPRGLRRLLRLPPGHQVPLRLAPDRAGAGGCRCRREPDGGGGVMRRTPMPPGTARLERTAPLRRGGPWGAARFRCCPAAGRARARRRGAASPLPAAPRASRPTWPPSSTPATRGASTAGRSSPPAPSQAHQGHGRGWPRPHGLLPAVGVRLCWLCHYVGCIPATGQREARAEGLIIPPRHRGAVHGGRARAPAGRCRRPAEVAVVFRRMA